jgi:acetyl esterase/lipase
MSRPLARLLVALSTGLSSLHLAQNNSVTRLVLLLGLKLLAGALAPFLAVFGTLGAVIGLWKREWITLALGIVGMVLAARFVVDTTRPHDQFVQVFGPDWKDHIPVGERVRMVQSRWYWQLPVTREPEVERDFVFWTFPQSKRELLCDIYRPARGVKPSGLAVLNFHSSAWHYGDKGEGATLFRQLTAQGHVVMDVAYRLAPAVDFTDMLGDVKRAISWMKLHGPEYGVRPERIVLSGRSAGAHLALLAAYTPNHETLDPPDVGEDTSVRAVMSLYGPPDLTAFYQQNEARFSHLSPLDQLVRTAMVNLYSLLGTRPADAERSLRIHLSVRDLLGGTPSEQPDLYKIASPVTHVGPHCPPTLLVHGAHDLWIEVEQVRALHRELAAAEVPCIYLELPFTEHGFDLVLPEFSPPFQAMVYDVERFLGMMV